MIKRICFPLLWPLSMIFTLIVRIRNYLFDKKVFKSYRSKLFVISIGNLSLGGNGKTPATML
ncbi:MAG: tetraacyldisaccharide 4'-kinase, partial [bacterium]|nr:tetraacyldisaccharide 4'-kinase [bacterium]